MADNFNIEFLDDPITMTFPFGDFKVKPGKLWQDPNKPNDPPKQLPDRYTYCVNKDGFGVGRDAQKFWLNADLWLHQTVQRAGVAKGVTLTIRHRVNPDDKKKKYWEVRQGDEVFSSLDNDAHAQDAKSPAHFGAQGQKAHSPTSDPPHSADDPGAASAAPAGRTQNGNGKPLTFPEVVCITWKCYTAALAIASDSPEDVRSLTGLIAIRAEKEHIHPTEKDMEAFHNLDLSHLKAAMKAFKNVLKVEQDIPNPSPKPPGAPATGQGRVAGSDPATPDVWFDLCQEATNANIPDEEFESVARKIVAAHLKVKALPASYDMKGMPLVCVEEIRREIADFRIADFSTDEGR